MITSALENNKILTFINLNIPLFTNFQCKISILIFLTSASASALRALVSISLYEYIESLESNFPFLSLKERKMLTNVWGTS